MVVFPTYGCCCCCCCLGWAIRIILTTLALLSLILLFFFIATNPHKIKAQVTSATLTHFNLNEVNKTLSFNLEVNLKIRNPNRVIGFIYDQFHVEAIYQDHKDMDYFMWRSFYQPPKNTTEMKFDFVSVKELYLLEDNTGDFLRFKAQFDAEKKARVFAIDVELVDLFVRVKIGLVRVGFFRPKIRCGLKVPLTTIEKRKSGSSGFNITECGVEFRGDSLFEPLP